MWPYQTILKQLQLEQEIRDNIEMANEFAKIVNKDLDSLDKIKQKKQHGPQKSINARKWQKE